MIELLILFLFSFCEGAAIAWLGFRAGQRHQRERYLYPLLDRIVELENKNVDLELREFARERQGNWWLT